MSRFSRILYGFSLLISKAISLVGVFIFANYLSVEDISEFSKLQTISQLLIPLVSLQLPAAVFRFGRDSEYQAIIGFFYKKSIMAICFSLLLLVFSDLCGKYLLISSVVIASIALQVNLEKIRSSSKEGIYYQLNFLYVVSYVALAITFIVIVDSYIGIFIADVIVSSVIILFCQTKIPHVNQSSFDYHIVSKLFRYSLPLVSNALLWWASTSGAILVADFLIGGNSSALVNINLKAALAINTIAFILSNINQRALLECHEENAPLYKGALKSYIYKSFLMIAICAIFSYVIFSKLLLTYYNEYFVSNAFVIINIFSGVVYGFCSIIGVIYICNRRTDLALRTVLFGVSVTISFLIYNHKTMGAEELMQAFLFGFVANLAYRLWHLIRL
jgi:O-antigen/teichoic acid export membrane protein